MRGHQNGQLRLFFTIDVESRIRADHPLRRLKRRVDRILGEMSPLFDQAYSRTGRPGVPPERLLKALLLQALYSVRSWSSGSTPICCFAGFSHGPGRRSLRSDSVHAQPTASGREWSHHSIFLMPFLRTPWRRTCAANGRAETEAALTLVDEFHSRHGRRPATVGSDKGYDSGTYYLALEAHEITSHDAMTATEPKRKTAPNRDRGKAQARARMKQRQKNADYSLSQRCRKKVEECFGWIKCIGGLRRTRLVGRWKIKQQLEMAAAAFNLIRMRKLIPT